MATLLILFYVPIVNARHDFFLISCLKKRRVPGFYVPTNSTQVIQSNIVFDIP